MIYLDHGATSWPKPEAVARAADRGLRHFANPGRGGYPIAMEAAREIYQCREVAGEFFSCPPEHVVLTTSCTHGLNLAIRTLVKPGARVVISGFEHNAVTRPLYGLGARVEVAGRRLFDPADTLAAFEAVLKTHPDAAVFTHVSNVFGYILPVEELARLCGQYEVPFILDAAQSAGSLEVNLADLGADFIAMPGHKGLQGPMGTGLLLCRYPVEPLLRGGTGSLSAQQEMPDFLPDRAEAGTANVSGFCGLRAGMEWVRRTGLQKIARREHRAAGMAAEGLKAMGLTVFSGPRQGGTVSFLPPDGDCETAAEKLAERGVCLRAGLHCAPTAHESAGTLRTGTLRLSFGPLASFTQVRAFLRSAQSVFSSAVHSKR